MFIVSIKVYIFIFLETNSLIKFALGHIISLNFFIVVVYEKSYNNKVTHVNMEGGEMSYNKILKKSINFFLFEKQKKLNNREIYDIKKK